MENEQQTTKIEYIDIPYTNWWGMYDPLTDRVIVLKSLKDYPLWEKDVIRHELQHRENNGDALSDMYLELKDFINDMFMPIETLIQKEKAQDYWFWKKIKVARTCTSGLFGFFVYNCFWWLLYFLRPIRIPIIAWRIIYNGRRKNIKF